MTLPTPLPDELPNSTDAKSAEESAQLTPEESTEPSRAQIPAIELEFKDNLGDFLLSSWQSLKASIKHSYISTTDKYFDEILVCVNEQQINNALHQFVTLNVGMVHDLHLDLHDDWLRLYATIYFKGIFATVATNLRLVHTTINKDTQRFVFEQLSNTDVIELHSKNWLHAKAAKAALSLYHTIFKKDPLPAILQAITVKEEPFAVHKGNYIYLDIHRYLAKQKKILNYLAKAQVNGGYTNEKNLLLQTQINFAELINFGESGEDIITEKDNPNKPNE